MDRCSRLRTHIGGTSDASTIEFATIELLDGGSQIVCGLEFDEAYVLSVMSGEGERLFAYPLPSRSRPISEYTTSRLD
jgi:hypothetical protein